MATNVFAATGISGSATGAMDSILTYSDGDICFVIDATEEFLVYRYESSNNNTTSPESSPTIIVPDDNATGTGAWILMDQTIDVLTVLGTLAVTGASNFTGNVDIDGALTFDGAGPAITAILDEDAMGSNSATKLATQQSIKAYVTSSVTAGNMDQLAGYNVSPIFAWGSTSTITIDGFRFHHNGTSEQIVKSDSAAITFTFGANGDALGGSEWHYLYLDDSAIVTAGNATITNTQLLNSTEEPTWDADQLGWYGPGTSTTETGDRCIGAFYSNSSNELDYFEHDGKDIHWGEAKSIFTTLTSAYAAKTFIAPVFCRKVYAHVYAFNVSDYFYCQMVSEGAADIYLFRNWYDIGGDGQGRSYNSIHRYFTIDSSLQLNFKSAAGADATCLQLGYTFPREI